MATSTPDPAAPASAPAPAPRRSWGARFLRAVVIAAGGLVLLSAAYTWFVLSWSYSSGERAGYVQKFSKKGIISKTWEGELAMVSLPGTMPEKFYFTVPEDAVAAAINASLGKKVALQYDQHVGIPSSWFGETQYFVNAVRVVE